MIPESKVPQLNRLGAKHGDAEAAIVRYHFFGLQRDQQLLLTLHLMSGFTESEIASLLFRSLPLTKRDIWGALGALENLLEASGLTPTAQWMTGESIEKAVCEQFEAPVGLLERILERIEAWDGEQRRSSKVLQVTSKARHCDWFSSSSSDDLTP